MRLALIGVGQAGGKIVDRFVEYDRATGTDFITSVTAINTARTDLLGLEHVPGSRQVLIGQSRTKGHGVGADNELGTEIARQDSAEIIGAVDDAPVSRTDAFLIVAALGGGTGSGAGPVIARHLKRMYTEPVYGLGILPASDEGSIYTLNAAQSFKTFVNEVDNLLVFDNEAWRTAGESIERAYREINDEIVRRFGVLFGAGELDGNDVAESVVDSGEIINTLNGGVSTVGYAVEEVERQGLLSRFRVDGDGVDDAEATRRITSLVRQATLGRLTLPCRVESTDRALIVVSGPRRHLSRRGIERGREWLESAAVTGEVRGGDYPLGGESNVAATVVLSGVTDVPRIDQLQNAAVEAQERVRERDAGRDERLEELLRDDRDAIDPLF